MKMTPIPLSSLPFMSAALVLFALSGVACGRKGQSTPQSFAQAAPEILTVDTVVNVIGGIYDELTPSPSSTVGCATAVSATCGSIRNNARETQYSCLRDDGRRLVGSVSLAYSTAVCSLDTPGSSVSRTVSTTITGNDFSLTQNTSAHTDYSGEVHPGGSALTNIGANNFTQSIAGIRRLVVEQGKVSGDFSVKTTNDALASGITRGTRRVRSGTFRVADNLKRITSTIQVADLQWADGCCFPVSGAMNVTFSGAATGTREIALKGCGNFEVKNVETGATTRGQFLICGG